MIAGVSDALIFPDDAEWEAAQAALGEADLGDGLPLVVPTQRRLDAMLTAVPDRSLTLGAMPPLMGELTIEAVAYCCVLAGCVPAELPVVLTAAAATLEPEFNLLGIQTTTGTATVCLVVHGSVIRQLGMNAEANCLGAGNRANACTGRALQLVLRIVGGAKAGISDMATMGQPGKYVFCFAENGSYPSLSAARAGGLDHDQSAVTIIGVSGTMEVLPRRPRGTPEAVLMPLVAAMHGARSAFDADAEQDSPLHGEHFLLIPPEIAAVLTGSGWGLDKIQDFILRASPPDEHGRPWPLAHSAADINFIPAGGVGEKMTYLVPWGAGSRSVTYPLLSLGA
jgi:hypothetical protein